jgi:hypothetical protein
VGRWLVWRLQDPFGNYVIQYILQKGTWEQARAVMSKLPGHMHHLSAQVPYATERAVCVCFIGGWGVGGWVGG